MGSPQNSSAWLRSNASDQSTESSLAFNLALAYLAVRIFPLNAARRPISIYSSGFTTAVLEIVGREMLELGDESSSFRTLRDEVDALLKPETANIVKLNEKIRSRGQAVPLDRQDAESSESWLDVLAASVRTVPDGCVFLDNLEKEVRDRVDHEEDSDDEELTEFPQPIHRYSPIGLFLRDLMLALRRLSFDETAQLALQIGQWCGVASAGPSTSLMRSRNRKMAMEDTLDKRVQAMTSYQDTRRRGDHSGALASLRRFYDFQFPAAGRGQHQHALLNLATFHHSTGGYSAAKEALDEAIRVARAEGDRSCLKHCISLQHHLRIIDGSDMIHTESEPQTGNRASPSDEIWAVASALDMGEPTHVALRRLHIALGRYESTYSKPLDKKDPKETWTTEHSFDQGSWHAAQAGLWVEMGTETLAELHQSLAADDIETSDSTRLSLCLSRAERIARDGRPSDAIAVLLCYPGISTFSVASHRLWARTVIAILRGQAIDHGALDVADRLALTLRGYKGDGASEAGVEAELLASLRKVEKMKDVAAAQLALPPVLTVMQTSAQLGLWAVYRHSAVLLAERLIAMESDTMVAKAAALIAEVEPEIWASEELGLMTRASIVWAKAKINSYLVDGDEEQLHLAITRLKVALNYTQAIFSRPLMREVTALLHLCLELKDDPGAKLDLSLQDMEITFWAAADVVRDCSRAVCDIVTLVGVNAASR